MNLDEYKDYLINYYKYECDNNDEKRNERKKELERKYDDKLLQRIINDTSEFKKEILNSESYEENYCIFELEDDKTEYISLGIIGGGFSDIIFRDMNDRLVSKSILKSMFGKDFNISIEEVEDEIETEDKNIMSYSIKYFLCIHGFKKEEKQYVKKL